MVTFSVTGFRRQARILEAAQRRLGGESCVLIRTLRILYADEGESGTDLLIALTIGTYHCLLSVPLSICRRGRVPNMWDTKQIGRNVASVIQKFLNEPSQGLCSYGEGKIVAFSR